MRMENLPCMELHTLPGYPESENDLKVYIRMTGLSLDLLIEKHFLELETWFIPRDNDIS